MMSPNNIKQKAEKYRLQFATMYRQAHLAGCKPLHVEMKYSTIRELLNFFGELAEAPAESRPEAGKEGQG